MYDYLVSPKRCSFRARDVVLDKLILAVQGAPFQLFRSVDTDKILEIRVNISSQGGKSVVWIGLGEPTNEWTITARECPPNFIDQSQPHLAGMNVASGTVYMILESL